MANTRQIKRRIVASQNISKITKAMEMVAASRMKRAQDQALAARPYTRLLQRSLQKISERTDGSLHPLLAKHETGFDVLVVVSTDKGLCGSLNTFLFKNMMAWLKTHPEGQVIAIGRKAVTFCRVYGVPLFAQFSNLPERVSTTDILPISTLVMQHYLDGQFKTVSVVYMDFINTLSQKVRSFQLLPLEPDSEYQDETMTVPQTTSEYIFEPSPYQILDKLLPYYIENEIYQTLLEGRASEYSARMVSMKNASENAAELVSELRLLFNKSRQANITSELLDITTAALTVS